MRLHPKILFLAIAAVFGAAHAQTGTCTKAYWLQIWD